MENEEKNSPYKLTPNANVFGKSMPCWHYKKIPKGMRPATWKDLVPGRPFLYQVRYGPDAGEYYTDYVTPKILSIVKQMIEIGVPVFVKD